MAIVQERYLFSWKNFQEDEKTLGDLERFKLVIETIPDTGLMQKLYALRCNGRRDHPLFAMWNSILAGIVFEHPSIESLRRELLRNAQLREICGFSPMKGVHGVPSKSAYSRFLSKLSDHENMIREIFDNLVKELITLIPDFGKNIAGDGKAIQSLGNPSKKRNGDKRHEEEADWGVKKYRGIDQSGKEWEKIKSWFGFRLHLLVDAEAELPISYEVTKGSSRIN